MLNFSQSRINLMHALSNADFDHDAICEYDHDEILNMSGEELREVADNILRDVCACSGFSNSPKVYVGTYGKYNDGSLQGEWITLDEVPNYEFFCQILHAIHYDESDPEFMFQDYECFPECLYSESFIDEETFDKIKEYAELDDNDRSAMDAYLNLGHDFDIEEMKEKYQGKFDSEEDFAEYIVGECYDIDTMMGNLACYFDYERFARDIFMGDYEFENGHVFNSY